MIRVYLATAKPEERAAIRLTLLDVNAQVVGESADWFNTLAKAPTTNFNVLLVDWDILPMNAATGLQELRRTCRDAIVLVLTNKRDAFKQESLEAGVDAFINKKEIHDRLVEKMHALAENIEN